MKQTYTNQSIRLLIESTNLSELKKAINTWQSPAIAGLIETLTDKEKAIVFSVLPAMSVVKTFKVLEPEIRRHLIKNLEHEQAAKILNEI